MDRLICTVAVVILFATAGQLNVFGHDCNNPPTTKVANINETVPCTSGHDHFFLHYGEGDWVHFTCPPGLTYSATKKVCEFPTSTSIIIGKALTIKKCGVLWTKRLLECDDNETPNIGCDTSKQAVCQSSETISVIVSALIALGTFIAGLI